MYNEERLRQRSALLRANNIHTYARFLKDRLQAVHNKLMKVTFSLERLIGNCSKF